MDYTLNEIEERPFSGCYIHRAKEKMVLISNLILFAKVVDKYICHNCGPESFEKKII